MHQGCRRQQRQQRLKHRVRPPRRNPLPVDIDATDIAILRAIHQLRRYDIIPRSTRLPVVASESTIRRRLIHLRDKNLATHDSRHGYDLTPLGYALVS